MTARYLGMNRATGERISDVDHISQSIGDILRTPVGSRVMRREYGSLLSQMIDQPQTPALELQIMAACYMAILKWEPRVRLAAAAVKGIPLGITHMAVGDGGGVLPVPSPDQAALINEQYRAPLNRLVIADQAANVIRAEMIMPPQAGGFWIREAALFDETGTCLAVANLPESYKPLLAEGSGRFQVINIWLMVSQTADVQMIADPSVILATVEEVRRAGNNAKDYADDIVSTLENETREAITSAVSTAGRHCRRGIAHP